MKRTSLVSLFRLMGLASLFVFRVEAQVASPPTQTIHVATALDHMTVLGFGEPVTQAAAGSSAFNIEWRDNNVFIKPLKAGVSTDLFVWTASQRHAYELDPPGDVKNMNYTMDAPAVAKPTPAIPEDQTTVIADMAITKSFLGTDHIESSHIKNEKGRVVVRIDDVFQSRNALYIRYAIRNLTDRPYRVIEPAVWEDVLHNPSLSLASLRHTQLDSHLCRGLGDIRRTSLVVVSAETRREDLRPGEETQGVIVLRQQFETTTILEIAFPDAGGRHVSATFVF